MFTITSTAIRQEKILAGFALRIHYVIEGTLYFEGRDHPIHAEGARLMSGVPYRSIHEAIQLGVTDAANTVKLIVNGDIN